MKAKRSKYPKIKSDEVKPLFIPRAKLDYHDMGILTKYEIERIYEHFMNECHAKGHNCVAIVTGKGEVVRPLVRKLLSNDKRVKEFGFADYFNGGSGAIEVWLV